MTSTKRSYFDDMYRHDVDPWEFETSPYERRKYALTLASLPRDRYVSAFEPGCSVGVLTEQLAGRCDRILATDFIPSALRRARARLSGMANVTLREGTIPDDWPTDTFDLVVFSEIAYYFDQPDLAHILALTLETTTPDAQLIGVHWRGETNYPLTGDEVHDVISDCAGLGRIVHHEEEEFVLSVWERS
jgi:trans-aconitate methyltransferase